jgi:putative oxidoreductase
MNLNNPQLQAWGITVLRVVVGAVFLVHGLQKLFVMGIGDLSGMFGGMGLPLPMIAAIVVTAVEALGGLALILGLFTRWAAIPLAIVMLVALFMVHLPNGFFVTGGGNGYEFVLTLAAANVALFLTGSGALALDDVIGREQSQSPSVASASQST